MNKLNRLSLATLMLASITTQTLADNIIITTCGESWPNVQLIWESSSDFSWCQYHGSLTCTRRTYTSSGGFSVYRYVRDANGNVTTSTSVENWDLKYGSVDGYQAIGDDWWQRYIYGTFRIINYYAEWKPVHVKIPLMHTDVLGEVDFLGMATEEANVGLPAMSGTSFSPDLQRYINLGAECELTFVN